LFLLHISLIANMKKGRSGGGNQENKQEMQKKKPALTWIGVAASPAGGAG
jgi:hypothetical protein